MRAFVAALFLLMCAAPAAAQAPDPAAQVARYEELYRRTENQSLLWLIAENQAAAGNRDGALAALQRVAEARIGFFPPQDSALRRFAGDPEYERLIARMAAALPHARRARLLASIERPGLVPEGIAHDERTGRYFVGDMNSRVVLEVDRQGGVRAFAERLALRPLGMAVDTGRRLLWVATTDSFIAGSQPRSALLAFDLDSGRLERTVQPSEARSINDVAVAADGTAYASDSLSGAIFRAPPGATELVRVTPAGQMSYPNGLALSDDGRFLFVSQGIAIIRVTLADGEMAPLRRPPGLALIGVDGLYWHRGRLAGVQNVGTPGRVLLMDLSADRGAIEAFEVLEAGHPDFDIPTTAALAGDRMVVIANSQLRRLADDGAITPGPPLAPIHLLEIVLPHA